AAQNTGHQKQPPVLGRPAAKREIAGDQAHHDRARDVDDEGAVRKGRAERFRSRHVHGVAQRSAKPAAEKDQEVVHSAPSSSQESPAGSSFCRIGSATATAAQAKGGAVWLPPRFQVPSLRAKRSNPEWRSWIASGRSLSSGRASRGPVGA